MPRLAMELENAGVPELTVIHIIALASAVDNEHTGGMFIGVNEDGG